MNIQQHTCGVGTEEGAWGFVPLFHYFNVWQYEHSKTLETYRCTGVKLNEHSTTHLWVQKRGLGAVSSHFITSKLGSMYTVKP